MKTWHTIVMALTKLSNHFKAGAKIKAIFYPSLFQWTWHTSENPSGNYQPLRRHIKLKVAVPTLPHKQKPEALRRSHLLPLYPCELMACMSLMTGGWLFSYLYQVLDPPVSLSVAVRFSSLTPFSRFRCLHSQNLMICARTPERPSKMHHRFAFVYHSRIPSIAFLPNSSSASASTYLHKSEFNSRIKKNLQVSQWLTLISSITWTPISPKTTPSLPKSSCRFDLYLGGANDT